METFAIYFPAVLRDEAVLRLHWGATAIPLRIKAPPAFVWTSPRYGSADGASNWRQFRTIANIGGSAPAYVATMNR